jgi:hypothetical protein
LQVEIMNGEERNSTRRIIETDSLVEETPAGRQRVRIPYQSDSALFGGWGVKL